MYDAIKNNAVSLDIFLEGSSFRQWWNKYEEIMGSSYCSSLHDEILGRDGSMLATRMPAAR